MERTAYAVTLPLFSVQSRGVRGLAPLPWVGRMARLCLRSAAWKVRRLVNSARTEVRELRMNLIHGRRYEGNARYARILRCFRI